MRTIIEARRISVAVEDRLAVKGVDLRIGEGEIHVLLGPNGAGKSTLLKALMGLGAYRVVEGRILLGGRDITGLPPHERARLGAEGDPGALEAPAYSPSEEAGGPGPPRDQGRARR